MKAINTVCVCACVLPVGLAGLSCFYFGQLGVCPGPRGCQPANFDASPSGDQWRAASGKETFHSGELTGLERRAAKGLFRVRRKPGKFLPGQNVWPQCFCNSLKRCLSEELIRGWVAVCLL